MKKRLLIMLLCVALALAVLPAAGAFSAGDTHYIAVASDRHGNTSAIASAMGGMPKSVDYVCLNGDMVNNTNSYNTSTVLSEVQGVFGSTFSNVSILKASHDEGATDGAGILVSTSGQVFPSGNASSSTPYYIYIVSWDDMKNSSSTPANNFKSWADEHNDGYPIIVISHQPIHGSRDNSGAANWNNALNYAATGNDSPTSVEDVNRNVIYLHGHNHTNENNNEYYAPVGSTVKPGGGSSSTIYYTYTTAGYLNANNTATLIAISDNDISVTKYKNGSASNSYVSGSSVGVNGVTDAATHTFDRLGAFSVDPEPEYVFTPNDVEVDLGSDGTPGPYQITYSFTQGGTSVDPASISFSIKADPDNVIDDISEAGLITFTGNPGTATVTVSCTLVAAKAQRLFSFGSVAYAAENDGLTKDITVTVNEANLAAGASTKTIYVRTDSMTDGHNYLIVNTNTGSAAGTTAYALTHDGGTSGRDDVAIYSADQDEDADDVFIKAEDVDAGSVWSTQTVNDLMRLKNGDYYLLVVGSNNTLEVKTWDEIQTEHTTYSDYNWTYMDSSNRYLKLTYMSGTNERTKYLRYANNAFSGTTSGSNIYIYEEKVINTCDHEWGSPTWTWTDGINSATASALFECVNCGDTVSVEAEVSEAAVAATCEEPAKWTFTATATGPDGQPYTDTHTAVQKVEDPDQTATRTVYVLTNTVTAGKDYLIVNTNQAGAGHALANGYPATSSNNNIAVKDREVEIKTGDLTISGTTSQKTYIANPESDAVWSASDSGNSSQPLSFDSSDNYSLYHTSGSSSSIVYLATSGQSSYKIWVAGSNYLRYQGTNNYYYVVYNSSNSNPWQSLNRVSSSSAVPGNVYFYEATEITTSGYKDAEPLGHEWGEPTWVWEDDGSSATAKFTCGNDSAHTQEVAAQVSGDPGTTPGTTVYTATVVFNSQTYTDTKTVTNRYTVSFNTKGGTPAEIGSQSIVYGGTATKPADPTKDNYVFDGWYDNEDCEGNAWDFESDTVTDNITLYAKWTPATAQVTVHHYLKGTTTKVADDVTDSANIGSDYTAEAATEFLAAYEGYTLTAEDIDTITVSAEGNNEAFVYYKVKLNITIDDLVGQYAKFYNAEVQYGRNPSPDDSYYWSVEGLLNGDRITDLAYTPASGKYVGTYDNGSFGTPTIVNSNNRAVNYYDISATPGKLEIRQQSVSFTPQPQTYTYNGKPQGFEGVVTENIEEYATARLQGNDRLAEVKIIIGYGPYTNAGTYNNISVANSAGDYKIVDEEGNDVTRNYQNYGSSMAALIIEPKEVGLSWGETSFTYDKQSHVPTATATGLVGEDSCTVTVTGAETAAGTYTATAESLSNSNYKLPAANTTQFTISPATMTIRVIGHTDTVVYDGRQHDVKGYDLVCDDPLYDQDKVYIVGDPSELNDYAKGTDAGTHKMRLDQSAPRFAYSDANIEATFPITDGWLKIERAPIKIEVTGSTATYVYDGTTHELTDHRLSVKWGENYQYEYYSTSVYTTEWAGQNPGSSIKITFDTGSIRGYKQGSTISETWYGVLTGKHIGTYTRTVRLSLEDNDWENSNFLEPEIISAEEPLTLIITPRPVTIEARSGSKEYDGEPLTVEGIIISPALAENDTHTFVVTMTEDSTITNVGTQPNKIATIDGRTLADLTPDEEGRYAIGNYLITVVDGELKVTKAPLTVTAKKQTYTYNASEQGPDGTYTEGFDTYVTVEGLIGDDALTSITLSGKQLHADTYTDEIAPSAAAIGNATNNYDITYVEGDLVINKAPLEITVVDRTFTYNGSPQGYDGSTVTNTAGKTLEFGLQGSDHLQSITLTGQETNVGEYPGKLVGSNAKISSPNGSDQIDVTEDYDITYVPGKLTIARAEMTVAAVDYEDWYDGVAHNGGATPSVAEGTTISYSIDGGETWTSEAPSITDVGTVNYKVKAENPNYETSTAEGTLKVKPQPVQINAKSASKLYDGTALTESGFTISEPGLADTDEHEFEVVMTEDSTITNVGGRLNTIATVDGVAVEPDRWTKVGNYLVTVSNGWLEVTPPVITIKAGSDAKPYDATPLTCDEFTVTGQPSTDQHEFTVEMTADSTITNAGQQPNKIGKVDNVVLATAGIDEETGAYKVGNYLVLTADGKLDVLEKYVYLTAKDASKPYDGSALTQSEFTVRNQAETDTHEFAVTMTADSTITNVGTQPNVIATVDGVAITGGAAGTFVGNYVVITTPGTLTITPATSNSATVSIEGWTYGETAKTPITTATFGANTATYTYSTTADGEYSSTVPSNAGKYYVKATIAETEDYAAATSAPVSFTIEQKEVGIEWGDTNFTYDGTLHVPTATATGLIGGDTCTVTVEGAQTDVGTYTATATGLSNDNYKLPEGGSTTQFTIEGASYYVTVIDDTKGGATLDGLVSDTPYKDSVTFTVTCDRICVVAYSVDGSNFTRVMPDPESTEDNVYSFTVPIDAATTIEVTYIGDVNRDGLVRNDDSLILARYLANWDGYASRVYMPASDVDSDGDVDNLDSLILARYLSKYNEAQYNPYFVFESE